MWVLEGSCLFLQGQWTIPVMAHELDLTLNSLSRFSFSSVDGSGIVLWDSVIFAFLLALLRNTPSLVFRNFADPILALSECYGVRNVLFRETSS